jgi:hypothetical protein
MNAPDKLVKIPLVDDGIRTACDVFSVELL